jgi:hypothetical protein
VSAAAARAAACAGCSNPNLPQVLPGGAEPGAGRWSTSVSFSATRLRVVHASECPDLGPECATQPDARQVHDQTLALAELRAFAEYGLNAGSTFQLQLPVKLIRSDITYRHPDGTRYPDDYVGIHHRDEMLAGLMDPWVTFRKGRTVGGWRLGLRAGLTLPLGRTEADPFAAGERGAAHQHIQFGTGTFNPLLGADLVRTFGRTTMAGYAFAQVIPFENRHGFRAGDRVSAGAAVLRAFGAGRTGSLTFDVVHEEAERWHGVVQQDGNLGRTDLLAGAGVEVGTPVGPLTLAVRTPVWQRVVGGQVSYPAIATVLWQPARPSSEGR